MRRLQYWHPTLGLSAQFPTVARDKQRAWSQWQRETFVYCLPELREPQRWRERPANDGPATIGCLAIPTENLERLTVFHIGDGGHVWGPYADALFDQGHVQGLLDAWLSIDVERGRLIVGAPSPTVDLPCVDDGRVAWEGNQLRVARFTIEPTEASLIPATAAEDPDGRRILAIAWPPEGTGPMAVSPDAELVARFGGYERTVQDGVAGAVLPDGSWRPSVAFVWPSPFDGLLGPYAGLDAWHALARMRTIASLARTDGAQALALATTALSPYVADANAPLWLACLGPDLMANRHHGPDVATWERYGLQGRNLAEALNDPGSDAPVAVRRVWGGIGLLWALLVDRLESATILATCARCGHLLDGSKRYCGAEDDPVCFRARRASDKRRSRATRAAHGKRPRA